MRIYAQNGGSLTRQERLDLATLLLKAGYVVAVKKIKLDGKATDIVEFYAKSQTIGETVGPEEPVG